MAEFCMFNINKNCSFFSQTPKLSTGVFHTTYTYLNTLMDGDLPLVVTSQHTVSNTLTAPDDYLAILQPSESATPIYETNTYYNTLKLTKQLSDSDTQRIISTTEIIRQVVITESLPTKNAPVMTSYIAVGVDGLKHNIDDDAAGAPLTLLSTTDVYKTFYVTYTYYNTFLVNDSTIIRTNVSTSSSVVTEKMLVYPTKKASLPNKYVTLSESDNETNNYLDNQLDESMNIYATKTYMTTYTYFTTLLQGPDKTNNKDRDKISSTVVNSHTRVVQNVITESIPVDYLPFSAKKNIHSVLKNGDPDIKYTTVATLIGGQAIQITAVKMGAEQSNKDQLSIATLSHINNGDAIGDDDDTEYISNYSGESEGHDEEDDDNKNDFDGINELEASESASELLTIGTPLEPPKVQIKENATKTSKHPVRQPVGNLIGSLDFGRLKALGPMFNAVAGLINNNFGLKWGNNLTETTPQSILALQPVKFLPVATSAAYDNIRDKPQKNEKNRLPLQLSEVRPEDIPKPLDVEPALGQARNPIYIPVSGNPKDEIDVGALHLANNLALGTGNKSGKTTMKHKVPIVNGGIAISPGEVIMANSDIIFGRPSGVRPRIPLRSSDTANQLDSKPTSSNVHSAQSLVKPAIGLPSDSSIGQSVQTETYSGPPPPIPLTRPRDHIPYSVQSSKAPPLQKIPIYRGKPLFAGTQFNHPQTAAVAPSNNVPKHQPLPMNIKHMLPQGHHIDDQPLELRPVVFPQMIKNPLKSEVHVPVAHPLPVNLVAAPIQSHPHQRPAIIDSNIIEIQQIPEVYSADLPPVHVYQPVQPIATQPIHAVKPHVQWYDIHQSQYNDIQTTNILPEIVEATTGQPLLVNIKPSQIAKVIIPYGSSSALIYGGVQEAHKNGQYFDDPKPHYDQLVYGQISPNINNYNPDILRPPPPSIQPPIFAKLPHSTLSNSNVNVHSHYQEVNLHAPPIIFNASYDMHQQITHGNIYNGHAIIEDKPFLPNQFGSAVTSHHHADNTVAGSKANGQPLFASPTWPKYHPIENIQSINEIITSGGFSNISANINNDPIDHSQAPSVDDDNFDDDPVDDTNENGEFIQESNNSPLLITTNQLKNENELNSTPIPRRPTVTVEHIKTYNTQTEENSLDDFLSYQATESSQLAAANQQKFNPTIQTSINSYKSSLSPHLQIPPVIINDLSSPYRYRPQSPPTKVTASTSSTRNRNPTKQQYYTTNNNNLRPFLRPSTYINTTQQSIPAQNLKPPAHFSNQPINLTQYPHFHPMKLNIDPILNVHQNSISHNEQQPNIVFKDHTLHTVKPTNYVTREPPNQLHIVRTSNRPITVAGSPQINNNNIKPQLSTPLIQTTMITKVQRTTIKPEASVSISVVPPTTPSNFMSLLLLQDVPPSPNNTKITQSLFNENQGKPFTKQQTPSAAYGQLDNLFKLNLNTGEVAKQEKNNRTQVLPLEPSRKPEYDESIRPQSFSVIKDTNADMEAAMKPVLTNSFDVYSKAVEKNRNNDGYHRLHHGDHLYPREPAVDMMPPLRQTPTRVYHSSSIHTAQPIAPAAPTSIVVTEVVGLQPPPLVTSKPIDYSDTNKSATYGVHPLQFPTVTHLPVSPHRIRNNVHYNHSSTRPNTVVPVRVPRPDPTLKAPAHPAQQQYDHRPIARPNSIATKIIPISHVHVSTVKAPTPPPTVGHSSSAQRNSFSTRLPELHDVLVQSSSIVRQTPIIVHSQTPTIHPTVSYTNYAVPDVQEVPPPQRPHGLSSVVSTPSNNNDIQPAIVNGHGGAWLEFNSRYPYPITDDTAIVGSEQAIADDETTTVSVSSRTVTPLPPAILTLENIAPTKLHDSTSTQSYLAQDPEPSSSRETSRQTFIYESTHNATRNNAAATTIPTQSSRSVHILPTKYITNTKSLTVTTTKTTVIRSQSITKTLTLTLTKTQTSTIVDTITHTLLQPTRITIEPVIKPTQFTVSPYATVDTTDDDQATATMIDLSYSINDGKSGHRHTYPYINVANVNHDDIAVTTTIPEHNSHPANTDSLFVVMTDRKRPTIININENMLKTVIANEAGSKDSSRTSAEHASDNDHDSENNELLGSVIRDEEDITQEVNHVLLGGILIASPPRPSEVAKNKRKPLPPKNASVPLVTNQYEDGAGMQLANKGKQYLDINNYEQNHVSLSYCSPDCKATRNERCERVESTYRCVCRPGFARLFTDHPCKREY